VPYQPIEDYGIIGNLRTAALIGKNGSIDWLCFPRFDSPSVFAAILDDKKGGYFQVSPTVEEVTHKQLYWPDTNILLTRFLSADGVGEITDFMPMRVGQDAVEFNGLIRRVSVLRGSMRFRLECHPAFNYARDSHTTRLVNGGAHFTAPGLRLSLTSGVKLQHSAKGVSAEFSFSEGQGKSFELYELNPRGRPAQTDLPDPDSEQVFGDTVSYWRNWVAKSTYRGR